MFPWSKKETPAATSTSTSTSSSGATDTLHDPFADPFDTDSSGFSAPSFELDDDDDDGPSFSSGRSGFGGGGSGFSLPTPPSPSFGGDLGGGGGSGGSGGSSSGSGSSSAPKRPVLDYGSLVGVSPVVRDTMSRSGMDKQAAAKQAAYLKFSKRSAFERAQYLTGNLYLGGVYVYVCVLVYARACCFMCVSFVMRAVYVRLCA